MRAVNSLLVPVDFSASSKHALAYAIRLADTFGASLHLIHVLDDSFAVVGYGQRDRPSSAGGAVSGTHRAPARPCGGAGPESGGLRTFEGSGTEPTPRNVPRIVRDIPHTQTIPTGTVARNRAISMASWLLFLQRHR
jgi:hypothetical protein